MLEKTSAGFRPDIEGLRAIAILLVVAYHADVPGFSGGFIGVDIFFVLSGYLITGLLVREIERTGTLDLPRFYARRARRLLPAMTLVLLCTMLASAVIHSPIEQRGFTSTATATASYMSNVYFMVSAMNYGGITADLNPLLHTWSLSVEEQFYLVWPLFVMVGMGVFSWQKHAANRRRFLLLWMAVVAGLSFALSYYLSGVRQPWAFYSSPTRAWEFALGAILVLLPQSFGEKQLSSPVRRAQNVIGWAGLAAMVSAGFFFDKRTWFPGIAVLLPAVSTIAVLRASSSSADNGIMRVLSIRPFQEIGRLSYSWYLWHWPVLVLGKAIVSEPSWRVEAVMAMLSLIPAIASFVLVEKPIRESRFLASRNIYSLAMAGVLAIVGIGTSFSWRKASTSWSTGTPLQVRVVESQENPQIDGSCMANFAEVMVRPCSFGPDNPSVTTLVLLGDSHALQWFPAVKSIAEKQDWRLISMTKSACALVDAPYFYGTGVGRIYTECEEWRKNAIERISQIHPALTIMASTAYYDFGDDDWKKGISSVEKDISLASEKVLILKDTPRPWIDVPECIARKGWRPSFIPSPSCDFRFDATQISKVFEFQQAAAQHFPNILAADVSSSLCSNGLCPGEKDSVIIYRDGDHISTAAARSLESPLHEAVERAMNLPAREAYVSP